MIVLPKYARLAKAVDELDARVAPKQCKFLRVIVPAGEDQAQVIERAFAEHIAAHPADAKCTVNDFIWIIRAIAAQGRKSTMLRLSSLSALNLHDSDRTALAAMAGMITEIR
jgi:hypothetical protein